MRHRRHAIGVHLAAFIERNILADNEAFVREMIAGFVGQIGFVVVVESPGAARMLDEMTMLILLVWTQPSDATCVAVRSPQFGIDTAIHIDRRDEDIGDFVVALGMPGLAGQCDSDLPELRRQGGVQDRF
jgi:hypothetical protein